VLDRGFLSVHYVLQADAEKKSQEESRTEQPVPSAADTKKLDEAEAARKQAEANLSEERARLQALNQELARTQEESKTMKSEKDEIMKKVN